MAKTTEYQRWHRDMHQLADEAAKAVDRAQSQLTRATSGDKPTTEYMLRQLDTVVQEANRQVLRMSTLVDGLPVVEDEPIISVAIGEVKKLTFAPADGLTTIQVDVRLSPDQLGMLAETAKRGLVLELYLMQLELGAEPDKRERDLFGEN